MPRSGAARQVRRVVLLVAGTVTGLVLVLSYRTPDSVLTAVGSSSVSGGTSSTSGGTNSGGVSTGSRSNGGSAPSQQTATGQLVNTPYGPVQVSVTVAGRRLTDIRAAALPNGDSRSAQISSYAEPQLRQQALAAQSAGISGVAGASYTSRGYEQSLQSALTQLGMT